MKTISNACVIKDKTPMITNQKLRIMITMTLQQLMMTIELIKSQPGDRNGKQGAQGALTNGRFGWI